MYKDETSNILRETQRFQVTAAGDTNTFTFQPSGQVKTLIGMRTNKIDAPNKVDLVSNRIDSNLPIFEVNVCDLSLCFGQTEISAPDERAKCWIPVTSDNRLTFDVKDVSTAGSYPYTIEMCVFYERNPL